MTYVKGLNGKVQGISDKKLADKILKLDTYTSCTKEGTVIEKNVVVEPVKNEELKLTKKEAKNPVAKVIKKMVTTDGNN